MSTYFDGDTFSAAAGVDLSAKQFYFGRLSSGTIVLPTGATNKGIVGPITNKPTSGDIALLKTGGGCFAVASATIAEGDNLEVASGGTVIPLASASGKSVGMAFQSAVTGDIFRIRVNVSPTTHAA